MRRSQLPFLLTLLVLLVSERAIAQSTARDSAGVRVVVNQSPSWPRTRWPVLDSAPSLIIGEQADSATRFRGVRSVRHVGNVISVVDASGNRLRTFDTAGQLRSSHRLGDSAAASRRQVRIVQQARRDTIVVGTAMAGLALYADDGTPIASLQEPASTSPGIAGRMALMEVVGGDTRIATFLSALGPNARSRPVGARWTQPIPLHIVTRSNMVTPAFDSIPLVEWEQTTSNPTPPWLSPIAVFASSRDRLHAGFGDRYVIKSYGKDGRLARVVHRAWTPTPITSADWEQWLIEWSKLWIKSTGAARDKEMNELRESPYAETLPAFSQFLVDHADRLWVREARWQDAIAAGSLTDTPAVESRWSVFDRTGEWLHDVSMPAGFQPFDIGADFVAGTARRNARTVVVIHALTSPR
jgi:hypothetical protein